MDLAPIGGEADADYAERYGRRLIEYTIENYKENAGRPRAHRLDYSRGHEGFVPPPEHGRSARE